MLGTFFPKDDFMTVRDGWLEHPRRCRFSTGGGELGSIFHDGIFPCTGIFYQYCLLERYILFLCSLIYSFYTPHVPRQMVVSMHPKRVMNVFVHLLRLPNSAAKCRNQFGFSIFSTKRLVGGWNRSSILGWSTCWFVFFKLQNESAIWQSGWFFSGKNIVSSRMNPKNYANLLHVLEKSQFVNRLRPHMWDVPSLSRETMLCWNLKGKESRSWDELHYTFFLYICWLLTWLVPW